LPSLIWNSCLLFLMLLAAVIAYCVDGGARTPTRRVSHSPTMNQTLKALAVALFIACASSIMDVAGKCWLAVLKATRNDDIVASSPAFWIAFLTNALFLVAMRVGTIYGCAKCDVLLFVPLNTMLNVFLSVATGIVVLNEGKEVYSWVGLITSVITVVGGILMLVTGPADATEEALDDAGDSDDAIARSFLSNLSQPISTPLIPVATPIRSFPIRSFPEALQTAQTFPGTQPNHHCPQNHPVHILAGASTPPSFGSPSQQQHPQQQQQQHLQQQHLLQQQQLLQHIQQQQQQQQQHCRSHQNPQRQPLVSAAADTERGLPPTLLPAVSSTVSGHHTELSLPSTETLDEAISCVSWMVMQENLLQMNNWHQQAASWRSRHHKEWESLRKIVRDFRDHAEEAQGYALQFLADMPTGEQPATATYGEHHHFPSHSSDHCHSPPRGPLQAGSMSSLHESNATFSSMGSKSSIAIPPFPRPSSPPKKFPSSASTSAPPPPVAEDNSDFPAVDASAGAFPIGSRALEVDEDRTPPTSQGGSRPMTPEKRPGSRPMTPENGLSAPSERRKSSGCSLHHLTPPVPFGTRPRSGSGTGGAVPGSSPLPANDLLEDASKQPEQPRHSLK